MEVTGPQAQRAMDDLNDAALLEEFDCAVRWDHYDPHCHGDKWQLERAYDLEDLKAEILRRMTGRNR